MSDMNRHTTGHLSACAVLALLIACTATDTPAGPDTPPPPPPPATGNFVLPVSGTWQVIQAPPCVTGSNHCDTRSQIYAIDVVAVNDFNGAPVSWTTSFCPTAGDVVSAVDGQPDTGGSNPATPAGNHIVIRRSPQEFVFVAHL